MVVGRLLLRGEGRPFRCEDFGRTNILEKHYFAYITTRMQAIEQARHPR
jgi:uncharacterized membrane protein